MGVSVAWFLLLGVVVGGNWWWAVVGHHIEGESWGQVHFVLLLIQSDLNQSHTPFPLICLSRENNLPYVTYLHSFAVGSTISGTLKQPWPLWFYSLIPFWSYLHYLKLHPEAFYCIHSHPKTNCSRHSEGFCRGSEAIHAILKVSAPFWRYSLTHWSHKMNDSISADSITTGVFRKLTPVDIKNWQYFRWQNTCTMAFYVQININTRCSHIFWRILPFLGRFYDEEGFIWRRREGRNAFKPFLGFMISWH